MIEGGDQGQGNGQGEDQGNFFPVQNLDWAPLLRRSLFISVFFKPGNTI